MFSVAVLGVMLDLLCLPDEEEMVLPNKGHKYSASAYAWPLLANHNMNLGTHLSRSNGYQLMGMFDESILILEE